MDQLQIDKTWKAIKGELEVVANPTQYKTHIPGTYIKSIDENDKLIEITSISEFKKNFIEEKFYGYLKSIVDKLLGPGYRFMFTVTQKDANVADDSQDFGPLFDKEEDIDEKNLIDRVHEAGLSDRYTIDRFIVGNHNKLAYAVSTAIIDNPGRVYNPFFLYSGVGLGKTHLVQSIGYEILRKHPNMTVIYKTGEQFLNEVVDAVRRGGAINQDFKRNDLKKRYRNTDVLIIDDIHTIAGKTSTQEEFFNTFNTLYMANKQIILTSDRAPNEIKTLEERLSSRFGSGIIADIQKPDFETRVAILKDRNDELNLQAPNHVIEYVANSVTNSIREMEGALLLTVTRAKSFGQDLTQDTTMNILGDLNREKQRRVTPNTIIREASKFYGVTVKEIKGQRRLKNLVLPRQVCMYLLREMGGMGLQSIGELLGNRDHSTVVHGINKTSESIKESSFSKEVEQIKVNILSE
jgi:chromosomal replication initiator protein